MWMNYQKENEQKSKKANYTNKTTREIMKNQITDKTIKKEIVRKTIMKDYIETCIYAGYQIYDVLGLSLTKIDYNTIMIRLEEANDHDKYTYIDKDTIDWYKKMIVFRNL